MDMHPEERRMEMDADLLAEHEAYAQGRREMEWD